MATDDLLTERLLRIIDEGKRVATYKLALLLALIDAAASRPGEAEVPTRVIAERVIDIYYPQTRSFVANNGIERELRQITGGGSPVLRAVLRLRLLGETFGCRSAADARARSRDEYDRTVDQVEDTFVRYPIPLLQVVGNKSLPFLYDVDWSEGQSVTRLRAEGRDRLLFMPGVPDRLVVLGPLLRPLIELHWVRDVARWTRLATAEEQLRTHLFGTDRLSFPRLLRDGLAEMQGGRCFYCDRPFVKPPDVDHFLAWSRWPNDAIENLVAADACNGAKSDHLAAPTHVERWACRSSHAEELSSLATDTKWMSDPVRTAALARSTYTHVVPGTPLWVHGKEFIAADRDVLHELVTVLATKSKRNE